MAGDPSESLASRPTLDTRADASPNGDGLAALPERIGPYELRGEIARGGMGVVIRALQPDLRREVALKLMRDGYLATEGDRQRFRVEAAAAASLAHPGIVTVHEAGEVYEEASMRWVQFAKVTFSLTP